MQIAKCLQSTSAFFILQFAFCILQFSEIVTMAHQQPHILMCPPDYYGIHYEINPWMDISRQAEHAVAVEQWNALHKEIEAAGAKVSLLQPVEGLPDLVFTANAAMIYRQRALVSRFRHRQRQGEALAPVVDVSGGVGVEVAGA